MFGCWDASEILGHSPEEVRRNSSPMASGLRKRSPQTDRAGAGGNPRVRMGGTPGDDSFYTEDPLNAMGEIRS